MRFVKAHTTSRVVVRYFTGRVPLFQWQGWVSKFELPLPNKKLYLLYLSHFTCLWVMIYLKSISCGVFFVIFSVWWVLDHIRKGTWHLLLILSGFLGTRGTHSYEDPDRLVQTRGDRDGVRCTRADQSRLEQTKTEVSTIREQIRADQSRLEQTSAD